LDLQVPFSKTGVSLSEEHFSEDATGTCLVFGTIFLYPIRSLSSRYRIQQHLSAKRRPQ